MNKFKLGFGPMSTEITDILCEYTEEKNLMDYNNCIEIE